VATRPGWNSVSYGRGNPAGVQHGFNAIQKRLYGALRRLDQRLNRTEIAGRVKVVRQTVARGVRKYRLTETAALKKAGLTGRKPRLGARDRERLVRLLLRGSEALGYETPLWTCPRVAHLIESEFKIRSVLGAAHTFPG
jgi:transposase